MVVLVLQRDVQVCNWVRRVRFGLRRVTLEQCAPGALGRGLVRWVQGGLEASWKIQCACDYEVLAPAVFIFLIIR